ncbi:4507_t:CDS:2 [Diversispora eburnea]|uniref:4507_t:CDS:1 n=1 Tax=Diversispora eburnea TaxID=1213867 RepID=A0A9N9F6V8_9GLOM|nr:4507_t:CDS:2 [Diversispora eburnea]
MVINVGGILRPYGSALWPMLGLECCSPLADVWIRVLWVNRYDSLHGS